MRFKDPIHRYIADNLLKGRADKPIAGDEELIASGLVDSLGIVHLVAFIEDEFGVKVPLEDITLENFGTLNDLDAYLAGRVGAQG